MLKVHYNNDISGHRIHFFPDLIWPFNFFAILVYICIVTF